MAGTAHKVSASVQGDSGESLSIPGSFLNDDVIDTLMVSVANCLAIRDLDAVAIFTTSLYSHWRSRSNQSTPLRKPSELKRPIVARKLHAWSSPIHCESHWTSIIALNSQFGGRSATDGRGWRVLYFDSLGPSEEDQARSLRFAKWVLELDENDDLEMVTVPTPRQLPGSNDCGLLAAHYIKVFFRSFHSNFKIFASGDLPQDSQAENESRWDYCMYPHLRRHANARFTLQKDLYRIYLTISA